MAATRANPSCLIPSTLGTLELEATPHGLKSLKFVSRRTPPGDRGWTPPILKEAEAALRRYLAGVSESFEVPLDLSEVSDFQRTIYTLLNEIPYGRVTTYGVLAKRAGLGPESARAVGGAVGANPLPIVIPCHRVIRSDGRLGGYSGGLDRKVELLRLEGIHVDAPHPDTTVHPERLRLPL